MTAPGRRWGRGAAVRVGGFAVLWWALAEGDLRGWYWGVAAVVAASATSLALTPPRPRAVRPGEVVALAGDFLWQSLRGALDVARRAVRRTPAIRPGVVTVELDLDGRSDRSLLAGMVSLLPGTVVADVERHQVRLHVLDLDAPLDIVVRCDRRISRAFGERASSRPAPDRP